MSDSSRSDSLASRMRRKRSAWFEQKLDSLPRPLRLLDVGGTLEFWQMLGWCQRDGVHITLLNLQPDSRASGNVESLSGDATDLSRFGTRSFDVVFSNSVIEHLFDWDHQQAMAREVCRVGRAYWVQTPNFWFPIEPHFLFPGWQWLPIPVRIAILRRRACGWRGPCPDRAEASAAVREIRLLGKREMSALFPDATIRGERFCGLVKSWIAFGGFEPPLGSTSTLD